MTPLPQSVYDDLANPAVPVVNLPAGIFTPTKWLGITRSNVVVNAAGFKLAADDKLNYLLRVESTPRTEVFSTSPVGGMTRTRSRLTGQINPDTKSLTMVEVVNVQPGEKVLIWAGVNTSDPAEPNTFIVATVDHVSGATIYFTQPLGKTVPNYINADVLKSYVGPSLWSKIGPFGQWMEGNYCKGFGLDHSLERFIGGMVHDVTINDLAIDSLYTAPANNPHWNVTGIAVDRLTINGLTINNPHGGGCVLWRCFNSQVNRIKCTGTGSSVIGPPNATRSYVVTAIGVWGGDNLAFNGLDISGTDITPISSEVSPGAMTMKDVTVDATYTAMRTYPAAPILFNFTACAVPPKITNAKIKAVTTGGSEHLYFSFDPVLLDGNIEFVGPALTSVFDFGAFRFPKFDGQVTLNGATYGPPQMETKTFPLAYGQSRLALPVGLYLSARLRLKAPGDLRNVQDSAGTSYFSGDIFEWKKLNTNFWCGIGSGASALQNYLAKGLVFYWNATTAKQPAVIECNYTYLPKN